MNDEGCMRMLQACIAQAFRDAGKAKKKRRMKRLRAWAEDWRTNRILLLYEDVFEKDAERISGMIISICDRTLGLSMRERGDGA